MDAWDWITSTTTVDSLLTTLGIGALAVLFATDRILTKGQHIRRVLDLEQHHTRERAEWQSRYDDLKESRDTYKEATREERERADKATAAVGDMAEALRANVHVLSSLEEVAKGAAK